MKPSAKSQCVVNNIPIPTLNTLFESHPFVVILLGFSLGWPQYGSRPLNKTVGWTSSWVCLQTEHQLPELPKHSEIWWSTIRVCCTRFQTHMQRTSCFDVKIRVLVRGFRSTFKQAELRSLSGRLQLHLGDTLPRHTPRCTESQKEDSYSVDTTVPRVSNHEFRPNLPCSLLSFTEISQLEDCFQVPLGWANPAAVNGANQGRLTWPDIANLTLHTKQTKHSKHPNKLNILDTKTSLTHFCSKDLKGGSFGPNMRRVCSKICQDVPHFAIGGISANMTFTENIQWWYIKPHVLLCFRDSVTKLVLEMIGMSFTV